MNKKILKEQVRTAIREHLGTHDLMDDYQLNESLAALNIPLLTESVIDELQNGDARIILYKRAASSSYVALVKHKSMFVAFNFENSKYKSVSRPMPYSGASDYSEQLENDGYLRVTNDADVKLFYNSVGERQMKVMMRKIVTSAAIAIFIIVFVLGGIAFAPQIGAYLGTTFPGFFNAISTGLSNFDAFLQNPSTYGRSVEYTTAISATSANTTNAADIIKGFKGMFR